MLKASCPTCISLIWKEQGLIKGYIFIYLLLLLMFSHKSCPTLCDPMESACQASLSLISWSLLKLMSIELIMPSNHLILSCPLSFCLQSFPSSGSFPMCRLFTSCGKSIGASAISFPMNIKGWYPLRLTGLVFLLSKGLSRVFTSTWWQVANSRFAFWKSFFF